MVLIKKGEKLVDVTTKKMETMASRLITLAATHLESSLITWNSLLDPQALQFTCSSDEKIDRPGKAGL